MSAELSLALDPGNDDARYNLARTLLQMGRSSDVLPIVEILKQHEATAYLKRIEPLLADTDERRKG